MEFLRLDLQKKRRQRENRNKNEMGVFFLMSNNKIYWVTLVNNIT